VRRQKIRNWNRPGAERKGPGEARLQFLKIWFILSAMLILVLMPCIVENQQILERTGEKYTVRAKTVEVRNTKKGRVTFLRGGVTITHGPAVITSQCGRAIEARDVAILEGGVHIVDGETIMSSQTAEYYRGEKKALLRGFVKIEDERQLVQADEVVYHRDSRIAVATGSVSFKDKVNDMNVEGGKGTYYFEEDRGIMEESPVLTASGEERILITAQTMETFTKQGKALVTGDVRVYQGDVVATCDTLVYMSRDETATLLGKPVITENENRMESASLTLEFTNRKLRRAVLISGAQAFYRISEQETNEVSGDEMIVDFEEGKVSQVTVSGSAKGTYHMKPKGE